MINRVAGHIENFIRWTGSRVQWLTGVLVLLVYGDVLLRYLFSTSKAWIGDLEWHVFALIFLLGAAYTLQADGHVRVDVFYNRWSARRKAWVDLIGTLIFLLPWCTIVIWMSYGYAMNAYLIGERSPEPGGMPWRFVIKGAIVLGFVLLALQAVVMAYGALKSILLPRQNIPR